MKEDKKFTWMPRMDKIWEKDEGITTEGNRQKEKGRRIEGENPH